MDELREGSAEEMEDVAEPVAVDASLVLGRS